jgi:hypothetical protein
MRVSLTPVREAGCGVWLTGSGYVLPAPDHADVERVAKAGKLILKTVAAECGYIIPPEH